MLERYPLLRAYFMSKCHSDIPRPFVVANTTYPFIYCSRCFANSVLSLLSWVYSNIFWWLRYRLWCLVAIGSTLKFRIDGWTGFLLLKPVRVKRLNSQMNALEISMDSYAPNYKEKVQKRHDPSAAQECLDFICWKTMIQVQILENCGLKS